MKFFMFNLFSATLVAIALAGSSSSITDAQDTDVRNNNDIPTTAIKAGIFSTLVAALSATDLVDAISSPKGPFTVFAPTDDAFDALPNGLVDCLLEEDNLPVLSDILLYHVASGEVLSTDLTDGMSIPTLLQGQDVIVDLRNGGVKINDSIVTTADVLATNGVIHIINQVLVPPSIDVAAFLTTCRNGGGNNKPNVQQQDCTYLGVSRSAGDYLTGPTLTCLCNVGGNWSNCRPNKQKQKCTYLGVSRSAGQYLTGPTHTCLCTSSGNWSNCRLNN